MRNVKLNKISDNYDAEVDAAVSALMSVMEPILIVGLGFTVGFIVVVYAVGRLPYTVRSSYAALQALPPAFEEAAQGLGASRARAFGRVTVPLVTRGLLVGGLLAFVSAASDLSSTLLLVSRPELGTLSYGAFVSMNEAGGRGPGAALGVLVIAIVAAGTGVAARLALRGAATTRS